MPNFACYLASLSSPHHQQPHHHPKSKSTKKGKKHRRQSTRGYQGYMTVKPIPPGRKPSSLGQSDFSASKLMDDERAPAADETTSNPAEHTRTSSVATSKTLRQRMQRPWTSFSIVFWLYLILRGARRALENAGSWGEATLSDKLSMAGAPFGLVYAILLLLRQYEYIDFDAL